VKHIVTSIIGLILLAPFVIECAMGTGYGSSFIVLDLIGLLIGFPMLIVGIVNLYGHITAPEPIEISTRYSSPYTAEEFNRFRRDLDISRIRYAAENQARSENAKLPKSD
jgi:hypothetical protein